MAPFPSMAPPEHVTVPPSPAPQPQPTRIEVPIGVPAYHLYQPPPVYKPLRRIRGLGNAAIVLNAIVLFAAIAVLVNFNAQLPSFEAMFGPLLADPTLFDNPSPADTARFQALIAESIPLFASVGLLLFAGLVCGVVFLWWLFRARANAEALAPFEHRRHKAWIIFGWFVPPVFLWFPKQIIDDIWQTSDPAIRQRDPMIRTRSRAIVIAWWLCYLAANAGILFPLFVTIEPTLQTQLGVGLVVLTLLCSVLGAIIVWAISTLQDDQRERKLVDSVQ